MIRVEVEFLTGDTYITKGPCQLVIYGYSPRCCMWFYQALLNHRPLTNGAVEFSESCSMSTAFATLKRHILQQDVSRHTSCVQDTVSIIGINLIRGVRQIMEASVLA